MLSSTESREKKVLLFGRADAGTSTIAKSLLTRRRETIIVFEIGDSDGKVYKIQTQTESGWIMVGTVELDESECRSVKILDSRFPKRVKGEYSHIIYVVDKGRPDYPAWTIFKSFFKGGEAGFVVLFTSTGEEWLADNRDFMRRYFNITPGLPILATSLPIASGLFNDGIQVIFDLNNADKRMRYILKLEADLEEVFQKRNYRYVVPMIAAANDSELKELGTILPAPTRGLYKNDQFKWGSRGFSSEADSSSPAEKSGIMIPDRVLDETRIAAKTTLKFVMELDQGRGMDGYIVSLMWLSERGKHEKMLLMSALSRAGYSQTRQTSTTTLFAKIGDDVRYPITLDVAQGADVFGSKDSGKSSSAIDDETSSSAWEVFQDELQRLSYQSFCVSKQWLSRLDDHEQQTLLPILIREAGYKKTSETSTTIWYEKIRGQVRNPTGDDGASSSSNKNDFVGGYYVQKLAMFNLFGWLRRSKGNVEDKDDASDSSGVANTMQTKRTQDGKSTCEPQHLTVACSSSSWTSRTLQPDEHLVPQQMGNLQYTMPANSPFITVSTKVTKDHSIPTITFSPHDRKREVVSVHLKAMATTSLRCCLKKIDEHLPKVRIKFLEICGDIEIEGPNKELCNAMVVSSLLTGVYSCIKRNDGGNNLGEPINLGLSQQCEKFPGARVSWEMSGRRPRGQEIGSTTLALLTNIRETPMQDHPGSAQEVHPLCFHNPDSPIVLEGDIVKTIHPDSFLEFHIRYLLNISYYAPALPFISEGPIHGCTNTTECVTFDCCFEIKTAEPL